MKLSRNTSLFFKLTSLACLTFCNSDLLGSTSVSSSAGDDSSGTLSAGIDTVNANSSAGPILIESGITPTLTSSPFSTITTSMTIGSDVSGSSRTINGNTVTAGINITSGTTTFTSDIFFDTTLISATNSTVILTGGTNNWNGVNGVTLDTGTVEFFFNNSITSPDQSFNGNITLSGGTALNSLQITSSYYESPVLTINGDITESTPSTQLEFTGYYSNPIILTGTNSWTGGTIMSGGTVQVNSVNSFPTTGPITLDGGLTFSLSNTDYFTLQGNITGDGSINIGGGNITLSGTVDVSSITINLYNATMTLSGTCSSPSITFLSGTQSGTLYVTGVLNGTSGIQIECPLDAPVAGETATIILSNTNTYTGGTYLGQYCTLQVNTGGSFGTSADTVNINSYSFLNNSGNITASTFQNYGTVTLSSGSNITIASPGIYYNYTGGTTSGCGTITGNYEASGESYTYPGCSVSDLTITGDAHFASGSILSPFLDPTGVAGLVVGGDLTLDSGSILQFRPELGCYTNGQELEFITTGGTLTGTFSTVEMGTVLLQPNISYDSNGATLTIKRTSLPSLAVGKNAQAVGHVVDLLIEEGIALGDVSLCEVIGGLILLPESAISDILDQMQPSLFKGLTLTQENNAVKVQDTLGYRMEVELDSMHCHHIGVSKDSTKPSTCERGKRPFQVWVNGMGDALNQDTINYTGSPQIGYHESTAGVVLGADYRFADCLYAGLLGAYTDSDIKWSRGRGKGDIQSAYTRLYFSALGKMFYGNVSVIGAWSHYDAHRNISLPVNPSKAKNKHGGAQLLSHADTGINFGWKGFTIRPFDSFDYISQTENGYTEKGADTLNLSVKKSNAIMLRNELGLNFAHCLCVKGYKFLISPKISWVREVRIKGAESTAQFVNTDESFTVTGYFPNRSLLSPGVSITGTAWDERLTLELYYNGEFNGQYSDHSYGGQVRVGF